MDAPLEPLIADASRLRRALLAADYTSDAVLERLGDAGQAGLQRNSTVPGQIALADQEDPQATCTRLWLLQQPVSRRAVERALPVDDLLAAAVLVADGDDVRAAVDVRPYGSPDDGASGWVVSDLTPGLDHVTTPTRPDYVLGVSPASTTLAQLTPRTPVGKALDLGTGCGVQAMHLHRHTATVIATDLNPRALRMAATTAALNDVGVDLRIGSLYEPVATDRFDLIVTNPPFVMSPPRPAAERLTYREGGHVGDGLVEQVVRDAVDHLSDGGMLLVLGNWAVLRGQRWDQRLASWADGTDCDLWVVERERLDVHEYIDMWLVDAGLAGSPVWRPRYDEWLRYFDDLGVEAVGMGWLTLTRAGRAAPDVQIETWPWAVEQPVGQAYASRISCVDRATQPDKVLLQGRWTLADELVQESLGDPGAADPRHLVLRSQTGFRRALELDTALGGVLGACDGDLTLVQIIDAVATILDVDVHTLTEQVLPRVRQALRDGLLT